MDFDVVTARYHAFRPGKEHPEADNFVPVRITLGNPRFVKGVGEWPKLNELVPWGLLQITDPEEFRRRYREQLIECGPENIERSLVAIYAENAKTEGGLALCCFEDVHAGEECHRRIFAEWWLEQDRPEIRELAAA